MPNSTAPSTSQPRRVGVVLANTGTPDSPDPADVRRFLAEFLADERVVDYARWFWLPLLNQVILRRRPQKSAELYRRVWTQEGSPLRILGERLAFAMASELNRAGTTNFEVACAMRYGNPSIAEALDRLAAAGAERLIVVPLFPQTSLTTVASVADAVEAWRGTASAVLAARTTMVSGYHDHPGYLAAISASIRDHWAQRGTPDLLLFSYHGIPKRYVRQGDVYQRECEATTAALADRLALASGQYQICYQSKFGPEPWLGPATVDVLAAAAGRGLERVDVVCPGFAIDCLETIDEIGHEAARHYREAGGGEFTYLPALNDSPAAVELLAGLVWRELGLAP